MRVHPLSCRSGKSDRNPASLILISLATLAALALAVAGDKAGTDTATVTDAERILKRLPTVADLNDLALRFRSEQGIYNRLTPPARDFCLRQPCGILVFDPGSFPKDFLSGLIASEDHGLPVYEVVVAEDPVTREVVMANAKGIGTAALKPEPGYDPWTLLREYYPDLETGGYSAKDIEFLKGCFDPARIQIVFTLLPAEYAEKYAATLADERAAALTQSGGGMALMGYSGPPVTNLVFTAIEPLTNGMLLTLAYPDGFTNRVDFFACTNLVDFWWDLAATTNVNASTNWIEWLDGSPPDLRFYAAGNADTNSDTDPDGDGLTWAREMFLYHSSPTNCDTDNDGLSDYVEAVTLRTDPCNGDTNKPVVAFLFPTNGAERVWMP